MGIEYGPATDMFIDSPEWVFTDALKGLHGTELSIVIHKTACGGPCSAVSVAHFFANDTTGKKSVHFIVGTDGAVVQVVHLKDGAGGNCCLETGHDQYWDSFQGKYGNLNRCTISIEHIDTTTDNSEPMTQAQIDASFALVSWLVHTFNIPVEHIKGHNTLDPVSRARCPGPTYPMNELLSHVAGEKSMQLDASGCVVTVQKSFQLEPGESPDLCGLWSLVAVAYAVPPGQQPKESAEQIDEYVDKTLIPKVFPGSDYTNFPGVTPEDMLKAMNFVRDNTGLIHYWVISSMDQVRRAIQSGYPVLISCNEQNVKAWDKQKKAWVPAYTWQISAGHVFPATGLDANGNLICPDQLNDSFQGYWPPTYKTDEIAKSLSWAAIIKLPFLKSIPDPNNWPAGFNAQDFAQGGAPVATPAPATPAPDNKRQAFEAEWRAEIAKLDVNSGIAAAAYKTYWTPNWAGGATSEEFDRKDTDGKLYKMQKVSMGIWKWDGKAAHYYPFKAG